MTLEKATDRWCPDCGRKSGFIKVVKKVPRCNKLMQKMFGDKEILVPKVAKNKFPMGYDSQTGITYCFNCGTSISIGEKW